MNWLRSGARRDGDAGGGGGDGGGHRDDANDPRSASAQNAAASRSMNPSSRDEMLRRRLNQLEKLMTTSSASASADSGSASQPTTAIAPPATDKALAAPKSVSPSELKPAPKAPRAAASPATGGAPSRTAATKEAPPPKATTLPPEMLESALLGRVLAVSLDRERPNAKYMPELARELREELGAAADDSGGAAAAPLLTAQVSERVLVERLQSAGTDSGSEHSALGYLLGAYARLEDEQRRLSGGADSVQRLKALINALRQQLVLWTGLLLTMPEEFVGGSNAPTAQASLAAFAAGLCEPEGSTMHVPPALVFAMVQRFGAGDSAEVVSAEDIFVPVFDALTARAAEKNPTMPDASFATAALAGMLRDCRLAEMFVSATRFSPAEASTGAALQRTSYLGLIFSPNIVDSPELLTTLLPDPHDFDRGMSSSLSPALKTLWDAQKAVVWALVKAGNAPRAAALRWFSQTLFLNRDRRKMRFDAANVSTLGLMFNVAAVLLMLSEPFSPGSPQLRKVDPMYVLQRSSSASGSSSGARPRSLVDYSGHTRLAARTNERDAWLDPRSSLVREDAAEQAAHVTLQALEDATEEASRREYGFGTDVFFLSLEAVHTAVLPTMRGYKENAREVGRLNERVEMVERMPESPMRERALQAIRRERDALMRQLLAQGFYWREPWLEAALQQFGAACSWIVLHLIAQHAGSASFSLPLPPAPSGVLAALPEVMLEGAVDTLLFYDEALRVTINSLYLDDLISLAIIAMVSSSYIRNPYLRVSCSRLVSFISPNAVITPGTTDIELHSHSATPVLENNRIARESIMEALFNVFVDVEFTGSHTQFYEKFHARYYVSESIRGLWELPTFRAAAHRLIDKDNLVIRLINLLLNDANHLLDQSLQQLTELHRLQIELESPTLAANERTRKEAEVADVQRAVKSGLRLTDNYVQMLVTFTCDDKMRSVVERREMVDRVAEMLNYYLAQLVGQKAQELNVRNREELGWHPRDLLALIMVVYGNFHAAEAFVRAVARDGRSYSERVFHRAMDIADRRRLLSKSALERFDRLFSRVRAFAQQEEEDEEALADAPDEFLDPIMNTLMRDPVLLPTSGTVCDRPVIERHLLSDQIDPFNRKPLRAEELEPDDALRRRVEDFVRSRRAASSTGAARGSGAGGGDCAA